jgi:asparagine synthase (glutamine-hydrolysing)
MCGIAGILTAGDADVRSVVTAMTGRMIHRGPNDSGFEEIRLRSPARESLRVGLGFRRLAIQDLSPAGHQPMCDPASGDWLVFNGELYNFQHLRQELEAQGAVFRGRSDSEVLLRALSLRGEKALQQLEGMFAFAFFDNAGQRLLLARDPLGIKPLYVADVASGIVFASEIRALLASGVVPDTVDANGMASMLAYGAPQDPLTIHAAIRSFPAGHYQWIDSVNRSRCPAPVRYWRFPSRRVDCCIETATDQVRDVLTAAVASHAVADVPVGVFLSAGIDSSILALLASRSIPRLHTFSIDFESASMASEAAIAAETAAAIGATHTNVRISDASIRPAWDRWLTHMDRPSIDGLNTLLVSLAARDGGMTVAMSGAGADELFAGYPQFQRIPAVLPYLKAAGWMPSRLRRLAASLASVGIQPSRRGKFADMAACTPDPIHLTLQWRRLLWDAAIRSVVPSASGLDASWMPAGWSDFLTAPDNDAFHVTQQAETMLYLSNTLLRDADVMGMSTSLEIRVPYLDRHVVELATSLPGTLHMPAGGPFKNLLRRAFGQELPQAVMRRPKTGFTLPIRDWITGPLREPCEAAIDRLCACPAVDAQATRRLWHHLIHPESRNPWMRIASLVVLGAAIPSSSSIQ